MKELTGYYDKRGEYLNSATHEPITLIEVLHSICEPIILIGIDESDMMLSVLKLKGNYRIGISSLNEDIYIYSPDRLEEAKNAVKEHLENLAFLTVDGLSLKNELFTKLEDMYYARARRQNDDPEMGFYAPNYWQRIDPQAWDPDSYEFYYCKTLAAFHVFWEQVSDFVLYLEAGAEDIFEHYSNLNVQNDYGYTVGVKRPAAWKFKVHPTMEAVYGTSMGDAVNRALAIQMKLRDDLIEAEERAEAKRAAKAARKPKQPEKPSWATFTKSDFKSKRR